MGRIGKLKAGTKGGPQMAMGALLGIAALSGAGGELREALTGERERKKREREAELIELERRAMAMREARQAKEQAVSMNLRSLALTHPDIYNSVAAGRSLPKGATWIGGGRRDDLLQELGAEMAQGSFDTQQPYGA